MPEPSWSELRTASTVLDDFDVPWAIAGGWAPDLHLGRVTRPHGDVDIVVFRQDQLRLQQTLRGWALQKVHEGSLRDWLRGEWLHPPVHEIHARSPSGARLEFLLNERTPGEWVFRRDGRIRCPLDRLLLPSSSLGLPYLCPSVVLLYKAKAPRSTDEVDFQRVAPELSRSRQRWLWSALSLAHPSHPWFSTLQPPD